MAFCLLITSHRNQPLVVSRAVEEYLSSLSPNYPSSYSEVQVCLYNISVPGVLSVCLDIEHLDIDGRLLIELAELEKSSSGENLAGTKVTRNDIRNKGTWCSQNNKMLVYLLCGDTSHHFYGFRATYRSLLREEAPNEWSALAGSGRIGCQDGELLTTTSGFIRPIYVPYGPPTTCMKYIAVPYGRYICMQPMGVSVTYSISVFDVGINQSSVLIASLQDINSDRVGDPPAICSESNTMTIKFTVQGYLFASYFTQETATGSQPSCGGTIAERNGSFNSPNYPSPYNENQACVYTISAPEERLFCLDIDHFDLGVMDTLHIHWTAGTVTRYRHILDRNTVGACSQGNKMTLYLLFRSDSQPHQGFWARCRSVNL